MAMLIAAFVEIRRISRQTRNLQNDFLLRNDLPLLATDDLFKNSSTPPATKFSAVGTFGSSVIAQNLMTN
jgi:hypothetical protein